jgi:hypothetical protein
MKKIKLIGFLSLFLTSITLSAQTNDTLSAKRVTEKGSKGDIILGNEYKQKQLSSAPQLLQSADSVLKKEPASTSKKKKCRQKNCCKTQ